MRILWFTGNPAMYQEQNIKTNYGGGWTSSLQREILKRYSDKIVLGVAIPWKSDFEEVLDGTHYYGIHSSKSIWLNYSKKEKSELERIKEVVKSFAPDVIHVFGSEHMHGLVSCVTEIPVIIHLQGIMNAIEKVWLPQNLSWTKYYLYNISSFFDRLNLKKQVDREKRIFANCKYFMGRTNWDRTCCEFLSPQGQYFYCSEMLRPNIYNSDKLWKSHNNQKKVIVSLISSPIYKGADVILKTAHILKNSGVDFEWIVYGVNNFNIAERLTGLKAENCNVKAGGLIGADRLVDCLVAADVFVHPSYIDNSPNSVCEAQLLGVPVIAHNVGGVSTLLDEGKAGILVPAGDILFLASKVLHLLKDDKIAEQLSWSERKLALIRHSPSIIVDTVINVYHKISGKSL